MSFCVTFCKHNLKEIEIIGGSRCIRREKNVHYSVSVKIPLKKYESIQLEYTCT